MRKFIPIAEPLFQGNELQYLKDCIDSGWISSVGKYVKKFEDNFAAYIGCKYGVALHTGTAALHLALAALGVGPGDEVIVPDLTFAATANAVLYTGAKPILVDVEEDTWNIDPDLVVAKISRNTKAIIPVHLYGRPCDMDRLAEVCQKKGIAIVEDAAEAHGSEYKGKTVGALGTVGCFSFFGNKTITTGEGGMCLCNDAVLAEKMAKLRDHGMARDRKYWHDEVGFNYRMTNLQAAVGVAQLEKIESFIAGKRRNAALYSRYLSDVGGLVLPVEEESSKSTFWLYTVLLKEGHCRMSRDELIANLNKNHGIECRPVFYPLHKMPPYAQEGTFPKSEVISASGVSLPSAVTLREEEISYICRSIREYVQ